MDVATLTTKVLSDGVGDDHGPQFAHDGQHIVFHSWRDGDNSVIYVMNPDGSQVTPISDPAGNALNTAWSPDDRFIAYQSNVDGDEDVYVYELSTKLTRKLTDNSINDYAPTWLCNAPVVAFTSDITGDSNIFSADVLPIAGQALDVEKDTNQLTSDTASDQYPVDSPPEESSSRQDNLPSPVKNK
jgi:Tol biopolymer transport system component